MAAQTGSVAAEGANEMRERRHSTDSASFNSRGRWERAGDRGTMIEFALEVLRRHGPLALIAGFLIYFLAGIIQGTTTKTLEELREHARTSSWVQRQECINLAVLAGSRPELCQPPEQAGR